MELVDGDMVWDWHGLVSWGGNSGNLKEHWESGDYVSWPLMLLVEAVVVDLLLVAEVKMKVQTSSSVHWDLGCQYFEDRHFLLEVPFPLMPCLAS